MLAFLLFPGAQQKFQIFVNYAFHCAQLDFLKSASAGYFNWF